MAMRISVIGTGYVGIVSGACFSEIGHDCLCVDVDQGKVDRINRGEAPIHENGLDELLQRFSRHFPERQIAVIAMDPTRRRSGGALLGDRIRSRADHVIEEMVEGLGGHVDAIEAPFDPEAGAYAAGGGHHHHDHDDDHHH